jgi:hypothetical protein
VRHEGSRRHGGMRSRGNRIELNRGPRRGYGELNPAGDGVAVNSGNGRAWLGDDSRE